MKTFIKIIPFLVGLLLIEYACTPYSAKPIPISSTPTPKYPTPSMTNVIGTKKLERTQVPTHATILYNPSKWHHYPYDISAVGYLITKIVIDSNGIVWGTSRHGVIRMEDKSIKLYTTKDGLPSDDTFALAVDKNGHVWVGSDSYSGKISYFDGNSWRVYNSGIGIRIESILIAHNGTVWFGASANRSSQGGVLRFDQYGWKKFTQEDGLIEDNVANITEDFDGNIWATMHNGFSRFDGKEWTSYSVPSTTDWDVGKVIVNNDGSLTYVKAWEIYRYKNGDLVKQTWNEALDEGIIVVKATHDGKIWFGMLAGSPYPLVMLDRREYWAFIDLPFATVVDIAESPDNKLWLSTEKGIYIYDN